MPVFQLRRVLYWFSLALLVHGGPLAAQTPAAARYRYWEAPPDSLRRVLAGQRTDTARLRTLMHLLDVLTAAPEAAEAATLSARLGRPEARAYRQWARILPLWQQPDAAAALLDSMQALIRTFDRLGRPVPGLLSSLRPVYARLNRQPVRLAYYQAKLADYQRRGAIENQAACLHGLGGYYSIGGDYNQAISCYLRAAELARRYNRRFYYNELVVTGAAYAEWGNPAKALHYLNQALAIVRGRGRGQDYRAAFLYRTLAELRLREGQLPAARRALEQARAAANPVFGDRAYNLLTEAALALAEQRPGAEVRSLLARAQHLTDSLRLPFIGPPGYLELDAAWARYYAGQGAGALAEARWLAAYAQAQSARRPPLRLEYLRELAGFYARRGQLAPATRYYQAAAALADTLSRAQGALHVAQYEIEQADRAQTARIAGLRRARTQDAAQARQRLIVGIFLLGGVALLLVLAVVFYLAYRRAERLKRLVTEQKQGLQAQRDQLDASLTDLRATQAQLIQREKMASLGELTAGIAHEIQNPLNFVNNFAEVSAELVVELKEAQATGDTEEVTALAEDLTQNLGKIHQHGQRAASIVRGMLEHSRASTGERTPTDLNALCDEYLRLGYHGLRAKDKSFNAALTTDFAPGLPLVPVVGADVGRVLLNLFTNAFYAVRQRQQTAEAGYQPAVEVSTRQVNGRVEIRVQDNGTGMPAEVQAKVFQPFFTTKPTGEGTGLGLSLSHDIIAQGHGGTLSVESQPGRGSTFLVALPAT